MPPGNNAGGNLNFFIFEVGMITRDPLGILPDIVRAVSIQPLVVVPTSIAYTDETRSPITETHQDRVITRSGRKPRRVQMVGNFGVESRGIGLFIGTGQLRFEKFWQEVVRLPDAVSQEEVDAAKNLLRSPFLGLALKPYDEENTSFYINFYDFWNDVQFEAHITNFQFRREHRNGGASGLVPYTLNLQEVGPIVTGSLATTLINGLFQALTAWDDVNELLKSYTLDAVVDSFGALGGIFVGQFNDTKTAVEAQIDGVTGLMNGFQQSGSVTIPDNSNATAGTGSSASAPDQDLGGYSAYLTQTTTLADTAVDIAEAVAGVAPSEPSQDPGEIAWSSFPDEGSNRAVEAAQAIDDLYSFEDAARFQAAVGALYGMSRGEFQSFLDATGRGSRQPNVAGSIAYTVTDTDIPETLEQQFGVGFEAILRLNGLTPDEALVAGTVLQIPRERTIGPQSYIDGLPVFGSHTGKAAWGTDLDVNLYVDTRGDLVVLEEEDALAQGIDWIVEDFADEMLRMINDPGVAPELRGAMLEKQYAAIIASDRRVASVEVSVGTNADGTGFNVEPRVTAINGGTISTRGPS